MIFYFSATGNNKHLAELLSADSKERLVSISTATRKEEYTYTLDHNEKLGFVIPAYFYTTPSVVIDFVKKLRIDNAADRYTYVVISFGTYTGKAGLRLAEELKKQGIYVKAQYSVRTVDTYLPEFDIPTGDNLEKVLDRADEQTAKIKHCIEVEKQGDMNESEGTFAKLVHPFAKMSYDQIRKTSYFTVSQDKCIGCGLCSKVCPLEVIELQDKIPVWREKQCTMCMGCLHRCPKAAIEYGEKKTKGKVRYHNPRTQLELLKK